MLGSIQICLLLFLFHNLCVHCSIPSLTVKKLDPNLIKQKRLDNFEMCRIFNAENRKFHANERFNRRVKRSLAPNLINERPGNTVEEKLPEIPPKLPAVPTLREEDARRVESIVDRLYDDLTENGERVTYRQREFDTLTSTAATEFQKKPLNGSGRRFDFAPAMLLGPESQSISNKLLQTAQGPFWIKKWKHGIVPYFIDPKTYDSQLAEKIMKSFDYFEKATCIRLQRLREKPIDKMSMQDVEWIYISNPAGIRQCVHSNEKIPNKGVQMVVLGYDCLSLGEILHEVMHVLGFSHEHTRADRSQHITVYWDNIKPGYKKYFEIRAEDPLLRLPYDYASVMHYPQRAFSKNGKVTLQAKDSVKLGQRAGLSNIDMEKVNMIFGNECVDRNKDYLLTTCPSVVKNKPKTKPATQNEIKDYFSNRIWPFGIIFYKLRDFMEFSAEEKENIQAVINHIQKETCIEFIDFTDENDSTENDKGFKSKNRPGKEKPLFSSGSDIEKPLFSSGSDKEKPLFSSGADKEKPLFSSGSDKDKPLFSSGADKEKPLFSSGSDKDKPLFSSGADKEKPLFSSGSDKDKPLFSSGADKEKPLFSSGSDKDKPLFSSGADKEKPLFSSGADKEKPLFSSGSDKDKPLFSSGADKEKPLFSSGADKNKPLFSSGAEKENLLASSGSEKEKENLEVPELKGGTDDEVPSSGNKPPPSEEEIEPLFADKTDGNPVPTPKEPTSKLTPEIRKAGLRLKLSKKISKDKKKRRDQKEKGRRLAGSPLRVKRRQIAVNPKRRHASNILVLTRSDKPGCQCPKPGKPDAAQTELEINADCFNSVNDLLHVFVHVLGLDHQHNMHDRDEFLHIVWDKLSPEVRSEMQQKLPPAAAVGFPYDYQSVMHYPWLQIKNGVTTIMYPIWNDGWAMGHWQGLSSTDVQKLNLLYFEQCLKRKETDEGEDE